MDILNRIKENKGYINSYSEELNAYQIKAKTLCQKYNMTFA